MLRLRSLLTRSVTLANRRFSSDASNGVRLRFRMERNPKVVFDCVAAPGERLLDVAQANNVPILGSCGGKMACSTCHVLMTRADFDRVGAPSEEEQDMLEFAPGSTETSRLACQIVVDASLDNAEFTLPRKIIDFYDGNLIAEDSLE